MRSSETLLASVSSVAVMPGSSQRLPPNYQAGHWMSLVPKVAGAKSAAFHAKAAVTFRSRGPPRGAAAVRHHESVAAESRTSAGRGLAILRPASRVPLPRTTYEDRPRQARPARAAPRRGRTVHAGARLGRGPRAAAAAGGGDRRLLGGGAVNWSNVANLWVAVVPASDSGVPTSSIHGSP